MYKRIDEAAIDRIFEEAKSSIEEYFQQALKEYAAQLDLLIADTDNIKSWYTTNYPDDELGQDLDSNATFEDLFFILNNGYGAQVYDLIGVGDSVIRSRLFEHLAEIQRVDYNDIYHMWLNTAA